MLCSPQKRRAIFQFACSKRIPTNKQRSSLNECSKYTFLFINSNINLRLEATSEDDLQTMAHHLNLIAKTKSMAMWGNHIQRVKIVINDNIIEQVTDFKYLGIAYQNTEVV